MAKAGFATVEDYLASMPAHTRTVLEQVRSIVRQALPDAEETISYQIPAYKLNGVAVIYFAGWKEHFSLYPMGDQFAVAFPDAAPRYAISKGTIRFPIKDGVPVDLIRQIVAYRVRAAAREAAARAATKRRH